MSYAAIDRRRLTVDPASAGIGSAALGALRRPAALVAIAGAAFALRAWNANGPFASSDHAQLAFHTTHNWGWYWCFQTHYGPLQPALTKAFATVVIGLGGAMTEALWRMPLALVGAWLSIASFHLARRLTGDELAGWTAALWTAVLPPLVADARYMWGYESLGTACAATALWAVLAYLDRPTAARSWLAGIACAAYLWSHLLIYALPGAILVAAAVEARRRSDPANRAWTNTAAPDATRGGAAVGHIKYTILFMARTLVRPGILIPPAVAAAISIGMYARFGDGPIARTLYKAAIPNAGYRGFAQIGELLVVWLGHVGYVMVPVMIAAFAAAAPAALRLGGRVAIPWWWAVGFTAPFLAPFLFKAMPPGRYSPYFTQATYALMVLSVAVWIPWLRLRAGRRAALVAAGAGTLLLAAGSIDATHLGGRFAPVLGVQARWGAAAENPGFKSAGWYIRTHTRPDQIVFAMHDYSGLELVPAGYYVGRQCLAFCDMTPAESAALLARYRDRVDVVVCERRLNASPDWLDGFRCVAEVRDGERALIDIYARAAMGLPEMVLDVGEYDACFDRDYAVRTLGEPLPVPPRCPPYREVVAAAAAIQGGNRP